MARETTIARPYAKALFLMAQKEKTFKEWSSMLAFAAAITQDKKMQAIIKDPQYSAQQIAQLFQTIGKDVFSQEANNFIALLGKAKRFALLPAIANVYEKMRQEAERTMHVVLTSAYPMSVDDRKRFAQVLEQRMQVKIELDNVVDPTIIGGAVVRAGDWVIDGSVRGKLAKLGEAMGTN